MNVNIFSYFLYTQTGRTPLFWACARGHSDVHVAQFSSVSFDVINRVGY